MNRNGFAILELLLALLISSILLATASLSFSSLQRLNLFFSARSLQSNLRYCQKNAVDEHRKYALSFFDNRHSYYISRADDYGLLRKISQFDLPSGIFVRDVQSISYTVQGTVSGACTIYLESVKYRIKLTIMVGSGRVKIYSIEKRPNI